MRRTYGGLLGLALLVGGCGGVEIPPPPTDPAEIERQEAELKKARQQEGAAQKAERAAKKETN